MHPVSNIAVMADVHKLGSPPPAQVEEDGSVNFVEFDNRDIVRLRFLKVLVSEGKIHESTRCCTLEELGTKLEDL